MSNITDRSPKIQLRISVLLASKIHAVINLLMIFQTLWRLLVSFGYKLRNEKKDQRVGPGSRLLMQTQTGFPGGKFYNLKDPSAGRQKGGVMRRPRALGTGALVHNEMTKY